MGNLSSKNCIRFVFIVCMTVCFVCLSGCKPMEKVEDTQLSTTSTEIQPSDDSTIDACSEAVKELTQNPYYHLVLESENDSIQTQIYCDGENYLVSDYDGELRLASAMKYGGIYAVEEKGKYAVTSEYEVAYADHIIQTYDILNKWNLEIKEIERESDRLIRIHAEWDDKDDGAVAHIQGNFVYEFSDNGSLSSIQVEENWHTDGPSAERYVYSLVNPHDTQETITNVIYNASQQITNPSETDSESEQDELVVPPSNDTEYDRNFLLGSDEMKWNYFDDSWTFALRGEDTSSEGIVLVHQPASETKDVTLEHGQEFFLESWDGNCWNLIFSGNIPTETPEENLVFSGESIIEPVSMQLDWGAQCGALAEGKYRVGLYYTATRKSGEQETNLCYAKFVVNRQGIDGLVDKCSSALEEVLNGDTYHVQRTNYMSKQRHKEDSYYYVQEIWRSKQNYYSEVTYYYNSNGEMKGSLGMLLRSGQGYSYNSLQTPSKLWTENKDLTEHSFQLWVSGLDCTQKTLENVIEQADSVAFEFSGSKVITYYFNENDELVRVTLEYVRDDQEMVMETELLIESISADSAEMVISAELVN